MFMQTRHGNCKIYRPRVRISGHIPAIQYERERERERDRESSCGEPSNNLPRYSEPPRRVILEKGHCLVRPSRYHGVLQVPGYWWTDKIPSPQLSRTIVYRKQYPGRWELHFFSLFPLTTDIDLSVPLIGIDSEFEPLWHDRHICAKGVTMEIGLIIKYQG